MYAWNSTFKKYIQRGTDIDGEAACDRFGTSVSLSADGKVLAIGAPWNDGKNGTGSGHVRVFVWNSNSAKYTQRGEQHHRPGRVHAWSSTAGVMCRGRYWLAGSVTTSNRAERRRSRSGCRGMLQQRPLAWWQRVKVITPEKA